MFLGHTPPAARPVHGDYDSLCFRDQPDCRVVTHDLIGDPAAAPPDPDDFAGVVLTGGASMVTDGGAWLHTATNLVRRALDREVPTLGICLGHQLLAHAAGADVGVHRAGWALGTRPVTFHPRSADDPLLAGLPRSLMAQVSHRQAVLDPRGACDVLGATDYDPHHVIRVGRCAWGVQFHPEFTAAYIRDAIARKAVELDETFGPGAADREAAAIEESPEAHGLIGRFVDLALGRGSR